MSDKKYYWLKLKKDFFKRHDIQIIEAMPNGKDYILFYLKMLVESVDHDGNLRFNDTIPYNENMLATITNTNIDIVRSAMKVFTDLKMIEVLEDSTIFMAEVERMLGTETYWAEQKRKQKQNKLLKGGKCPENVQTISNESNQELDIDIELDIDKDIKKIIGDKPQTTKFTPPTIEQVQEYCKERNNTIDAEKFVNHYAASNWFRGKTKIKNWKACVITWEKNDRGGVTTGNNKTSKPVCKDTEQYSEVGFTL
jgi:predicted phage replisome organizer